MLRISRGKEGRRAVHRRFDEHSGIGMAPEGCLIPVQFQARKEQGRKKGGRKVSCFPTEDREKKGKGERKKRGNHVVS